MRRCRRSSKTAGNSRCRSLTRGYLSSSSIPCSRCSSSSVARHSHCPVSSPCPRSIRKSAIPSSLRVHGPAAAAQVGAPPGLQPRLAAAGALQDFQERARPGRRAGAARLAQHLELLQAQPQPAQGEVHRPGHQVHQSRLGGVGFREALQPAHLLHDPRDRAGPGPGHGLEPVVGAEPVEEHRVGDVERRGHLLVGHLPGQAAQVAAVEVGDQQAAPRARGAGRGRTGSLPAGSGAGTAGWPRRPRRRPARKGSR